MFSSSLRPRLSAPIGIVVVGMVWGCGPQQSPTEGGVDAEARAFMESYAQDLRDGDAEAIASRYSRSGAYRLGNGRKAFNTYDSIRSSYVDRWRRPSSFEWRDLSYEVIGPDAVAVLGTFRWGRGDSLDVLNFSYTGLLVREDGELRIRVEDESMDPQSLD